MTRHAVVIVGGGPTGLMLAGELALAGVDVATVERRTAQDGAGVDVGLADGRSLRAEYLVGCDGGRSLIRRAAGIEFSGSDPASSYLIAEVELAEEPEWGLGRDARGPHVLARPEADGPVRVLVTEPRVEQPGEPSLGDLSQALTAAYGTDYGVHS